MISFPLSTLVSLLMKKKKKFTAEVQIILEASRETTALCASLFSALQLKFGKKSCFREKFFRHLSFLMISEARLEQFLSMFYMFYSGRQSNIVQIQVSRKAGNGILSPCLKSKQNCLWYVF